MWQERLLVGLMAVGVRLPAFQMKSTYGFKSNRCAKGHTVEACGASGVIICHTCLLCTALGFTLAFRVGLDLQGDLEASW